MPPSDKPAAYSAMPIDFRKSAIVAKRPSVTRLAHTIKTRTYIRSSRLSQ